MAASKAAPGAAPGAAFGAAAGTLRGGSGIGISTGLDQRYQDAGQGLAQKANGSQGEPFSVPERGAGLQRLSALVSDRKSTRLNSSHLVISYAVFCLKKKNLV